MTSPETTTIHPKRVTPAEDNLPLVSPIYQSVKYVPRDVAHLREILTNRGAGYLYSRVVNPTVRELELLLAKLQGRDDALCVASGIAAIATTVTALVKSGDHVVMFRESYKPTRFLQQFVLSKMGVRTTILALDDRAGLEKIFRDDPPALLLIESPTNPMVRIPDLRYLTKLCRASKTLSVLDNTFAGFMHHGDQDIDIFVHSLTKHACGHSDAMGGVIIARQELIDKIFPVLITLGSTLDPHAAWLISRGMKTYHLRTKASSDNAHSIFQWLKKRNGIKNLRYPADPQHQDYAVWQRQMKNDGGSVIAFDVDGTQSAMDAFINALELFSLTPSMGCVESLVAPCLPLFADDLSADHAKAAGIGPTTVRLAVGVENKADLIEDLNQALVKAGFV